MLRRVPALPDPFELRAIAGRIAGHAGATRERAHWLEQAVSAVAWRGLAAVAFYLQAADAVGTLRSAATGLDTAAAALRRHADRVEAVIGQLIRLATDELDLLDDVVHLRPGDVLSDAGHIIGDGVGVLADLAPW